ncbi:MAG TPA: 2-amino-4-hydroxy-6-hydroxymethyldihydropteridine diphosphokinase [Aestuariivirgaceae bacterium]|jgi:2-amino-4-hydroxy-6-hydroxymethyldihydropteridine diphosphokinase|nr:2-amino-4-hydroxy-6-hydroxymethyldihydropteridine diphosphokinase [Aestuariivirgaceae bacterium]
MILIGIGSNMPGSWGTPEATVVRVPFELDRGPVRVTRVSSPVRTTPFGVTDQPAFTNAALAIETDLAPSALLLHLQALERRAGRHREIRWGPRTLDLDILDYRGLVLEEPSGLVLPHPGIAERPFVLIPIIQIAPEWRHPVTGLTAAEMLAKVAPSAEGVVLSE